MQLTVSAKGCQAPPRLQERLERHLQFSLGRFGGHIGHVELRLDRSPVVPDHRCRITIMVRSLGKIESDAIDSDCERAALRAADRAARRIQYELPIRTEGVIPGVVG